VYASAKKLFWSIRLVVILLTLTSLLSPILALAYVTSKGGRLGIVCAATSFFAFGVALTTNARNVEVLAATAA
jgi:hypothetical protein